MWFEALQEENYNYNYNEEGDNEDNNNEDNDNEDNDNDMPRGLPQKMDEDG